VPPVAAIVLEYAEPFMPEGKPVVVITRACAMTSLRVMDLACGGLDESTTLKVKLALPLAVGVPEMVPVLAARLRPAGRVPLVMDQV
jgi:hypothetical protein